MIGALEEKWLLEYQKRMNAAAQELCLGVITTTTGVNGRSPGKKSLKMVFSSSKEKVVQKGDFRRIVLNQNVSDPK